MSIRKTEYSPSAKIVRETHLLSERTQPAVIIELPESERQTGTAKSVVRRRLLTNRVKLRSHIAVSFSSKKEVIGKSYIRPPYGFCYFQGQIVPDQKEYRNLLLIFKLWKSQAQLLYQSRASNWGRPPIFVDTKKIEIHFTDF